MDEIKLNLGCGETDTPGWVGIDAGNYPHVKWHHVDKIPYTNETVSVVYASHLIAYFDRDEIKPILQEWFRVLKHGGILQISTPDWDVLRTLPRPLIGPLYGKMSNPTIYHKTVYSYDELYQVLRTAGFINIERWPHVSGKKDCSSATYDGKEISLNVNAYKP